jgi:hypothetical protein
MGGEKKAVLHRARLKKTQLNIGPEALSGEKGSYAPRRLIMAKESGLFHSGAISVLPRKSVLTD